MKSFSLIHLALTVLVHPVDTARSRDKVYVYQKPVRAKKLQSVVSGNKDTLFQLCTNPILLFRPDVGPNDKAKFKQIGSRVEPSCVIRLLLVLNIEYIRR